jgi:oligosaccharide repeat unit polymerase
VQIYEILPTLRAVGGLHAVFGGTSSGIEFRRDLQQQASDAAATQFSGGSALLGALGYVLFLGTISLFMGARYVRTGRIVRGLLPLILMAAYSVLTVQRFTFVYSLVLFTFAYYYYAGSARRRERRASRRAWLAAGALVVLLPAIVYIPLKARQPGTTPAVAVQSALSYYVDGLGSLNVRERGDPRAGSFPRGYGAWSFFGVASIASRVGAPVYLPPNTLPFVNPRTRGIGSSNVYTFLVYFLDDFGTAGVIVIPMLLGALTSLLHYQVRLRARSSLIPAASILSTTVVMSFFGFSLIRDIRYPVLAVASIFVLRWASAARTGASSGTVSPHAAVPSSAYLALSE